VLIDYALNYTHESYWALRAQMLKPPGARDAAIIEEKRRSLRDLLQYLEDALSNSDYFLGELSLTDIAIVPRALRMETYGALPSPSLRRLGAWLHRMKERPSVSRLL
jgi:glutathione S-transferase